MYLFDLKSTHMCFKPFIDVRITKFILDVILAILHYQRQHKQIAS